MTRLKVDPLEGRDPRASQEDAWACVVQWDGYLRRQVQSRCHTLPPSCELADVEQLARELSLRQVRRWDPSRLTLSAWTRQAMWYSVGVAIARIRPKGSRRAALIANCCERAWGELVDKLGRSPTYDEVSKVASEHGRSFASHISPALVERWVTVGNPDEGICLQERATEGGGHILEEILTTETRSDQEDGILDAMRLTRIRAALDAIPNDRARKIMVLHHIEDHTYADLARRFGISDSLVKQIERVYRERIIEMISDGGLTDPEAWFRLDVEDAEGPPRNLQQPAPHHEDAFDIRHVPEILSQAGDREDPPRARRPGSGQPLLAQNDASMLFADF